MSFEAFSHLFEIYGKVKRWVVVEAYVHTHIYKVVCMHNVLFKLKPKICMYYPIHSYTYTYVFLSDELLFA